MIPFDLGPGIRHIVLVGLMGAGKTSVGRRLAQRLGLPFIDADAEIEKAAGCTIVEIFRLYGEKAFRDGERRVLARILESPPSVLATGGGAFMDPQTREHIRKRGVSVWLRADVDVLFRRTRKRSARPLLNNENPRATLERLSNLRSTTYAEADIIIDTDNEKPNETVDHLLAELERATAAAAKGKMS